MKIVEQKQYDIFVAGGGVAGVAAALQAARCGKKVLIAEKCVQLGGLATAGLVNLFVPMCNGRGTQIIKGMADEFLRLSIKYGYDDMPVEWQNGEPGQGKTNKRLVTHFSAPIFALALRKLVDDHGIDVLFDTVVTDVEQENGHIHAAILFNKSGYTRVTAKIFIDTTGDCDLLTYAGIPTVKRGNYHTYAGITLTLDTCQKAVEAGDVAKLYFDTPGGNATMSGQRHPEGMPLWDGTDGNNISEYFRVNQLELLERIKDQPRKERDIVMLITMYEEVGHGASFIPADLSSMLGVDMGCIGSDLACTEYDVSICAKDSHGPYDYELTSRLIALAKDNDLSMAVDVYPYYGSDVGAMWTAGHDIPGALIGTGVHASHGMERTHWEGIYNTLALTLLYFGVEGASHES